MLHRLYRQLRRESEDLHRGVSPLQNLLLTAIIEHPGIGVADLARIEKLPGPTISGHVKRLELARLIARAAPQRLARASARGYVVRASRAIRERDRGRMSAALSTKVARGRQIDYIDMINRAAPKGELLCEFKREGFALALPAVQFFSVQ